MSAGEFVPPTSEELDALLPDCTVETLIAQGGMGAIYRGLQTKLDRPVAIKVLPKSFGADLDYASRFEQEAKAMAKLSHNNIVGVYDYGETSDGTMLYFIMEFIEGSDLYTLLHHGSISYAQALPLLVQICDALQYAHTNGIVHRDIKPANILIDNTNVVKMADFGLAKVQLAGAEDPDGAESGTAFGTPDYIAPEALVEGVEIDHRADIYSLGVVIYEVLTGQIPKGTFDLPSTINPEVDRRIDDLIVKAMAHDRDLRYSEVAEMKTVLAAVEKTPRLVAGGKGGAAPAVAVRPAGATGRVAVSAGGRAAGGAPRTLAPAKSSNTGAITAALLLVALAAGAGLYVFVFKPGIDAGNQVAPPPPGTGASTDKDPGSEFFAPDKDKTAATPVPGNTGEMPDDSATPDGDTNPESPAEVFVPVPEPITPIPYAGTLRAFGSLKDQDSIDISLASGVDNIVTVEVRDSHWHALRLTGDTISSSSGQHKMTGIRWVDARKGSFRAVRADGTAWQGKQGPILPRKITNALMCMGRAGHSTILHTDGTITVFGTWYGGGASDIGEPPLPFKDIVDIASVGGWETVVDRAGIVYVWGKDTGVVKRVPANEGDGVVDVEPCGNDFVALTRSGRVFSWHFNNILSPHNLRDEISKGYFIKVRGGNSIRAAQRADGTWLAWGNTKWGVIDKINSLPPTPDIAFVVYAEFGAVLWIDPNPAHMPGAEYTSTAGPGSEVPFFSDTVDMSGGSPSSTPDPAAAIAAVPNVDPSTLTGADRIVAELRQKVLKRHGEMVQKPYLAALGQLNDKYVPALRNAAAAAVKEGDAYTAKAISDDVTDAEKIIGAAATSGAAPVLVTNSSNSGSIAPGLKSLRTIYLTEHGKLAEQRDTNARAVLNTYITDLELLESQIESSQGASAAAPVKTAIDSARSTGLGLFELE